MFHVASLHFPAIWDTNSPPQFKCHVDHLHVGAVGHVTIPTSAAMVRPVLDCARPPLAPHQVGVKVWQESSGEILPQGYVWVCVKVAPSAQLGAVVVLDIAVVGHGMSDAICANEKPDAILEQESPLKTFSPPVGPRARRRFEVLHKTKINP